MKKLIIILLFASPAFGQAWSGVLAPNRAIDWSGNGATITNRTLQCGATIAAYTGSAAAINSAISSCPGGSFVQLGAGVFTLSSSIVATTSNVTLRGMGSNSTFLVFTATSTNCNGVNATSVCIWNGDSSSFQFAGGNHQNWTANYGRGGTILQFAATTNLHPGSNVILTQNDDATDPGNIYVCQTSGSNGVCSQQGGGGVAKAGQAEAQNVTVVSIAGSLVTVTPSIYATNWAPPKVPNAWWSSNLPITGFGIENLSLDYSNMGSKENGIEFHSANNCWVKGVRSINSVSAGGATHKHINIYASNHVTVRDSYFYGASPTSEGYGVDFGPGTSNGVAENNICQHLPTCMINETSSGNVFGYNFAIDNFYNGGGSSPNWQQQDGFHHGAGDNYTLYEGNEGIGFDADAIHGTSWMFTHHRNYLSGHDPSTETGVKNQATFAYFLFAYSRFYNATGNVFGTQSYHTIYNTASSSPTDCGNAGTSAQSVYVFGYADQAGVAFSPCGVGAGFTINNDSLVASTLMRWGNYVACTGDAACNAVRFQTSEDASAAPVYPGLVSPSTTLPASYYLSGTPSFWGSMPFPAVGPDVAGGNIPNVGGHAYHNPAALCALNVMGINPNGSSGPQPFNPATCYSAPPPTVPTPGVSPASGVQTNPATVTVTCPSGATCGYTTDGSTPTASSGTITHGTTYTVPFSIAVPGTVKVIGSESGFTNSSVVTNVYTTIGAPSQLSIFLIAKGGY